jgi:aryl-alcohol dehydrogenase-like predicted oxidoreductase
LDVLVAAYDAGIRMFDTADFYGDGANEALLAKFMALVGDDVTIATKCGIVRGTTILPDGNFQRLYDGSPSYIRKACERSLKRLKREQIDLFYLHRIDPKIAIEDSVGELADLVAEGKIAAIGLSEASEENLRRAVATHPIAALQSEYSIWTQDTADSMLPTCRELGVAYVPYAPLGRGIMSQKQGTVDVSFAKGDFRATLERAQKDNLERNQRLTDLLYETGSAYGLSAFELSLAWVLSRGDDILPIPGMRRMTSLLSNLKAENAVVPKDVLDGLTTAFAQDNIAGGRYTVEKGVTENQGAAFS